MTDKADSVSGKIRKIITDLGPLGMIALIASVFIFMSLFQDDFSGGLFSGSSSSSEMSDIEERQREKITALFDPIEDVTVDNIIISYDTITDSSSSTIFTSNQSERVVARSVVILHQGSIMAEYDVTRAISLLLDVPFHQISLINTLDIIGGN